MEREEICHFCEKTYIETWPAEDLAANTCEVCCNLSTKELGKKYPEKLWLFPGEEE